MMGQHQPRAALRRSRDVASFERFKDADLCGARSSRFRHISKTNTISTSPNAPMPTTRCRSTNSKLHSRKSFVIMLIHAGPFD